MKIEKVNLTPQNLLLMRKIDNQYYRKNITDIEWYMERYQNNNEAFFLMDNGKCVGYIAAFPIKEALYEALMSGVLINDLYINPKMFVEKSNYYYIYSIVILKKYRNKGYGKQLLESILNQRKGNYCVLTVSDNGYKLMSKYMNLVLTIDKNTHIFEKSFT